MTIDPDEETCPSRGPRIGEEGVPLCVLPRYHNSPHVPDESWHSTIKSWTDHAYGSKSPNIDYDRWAEEYTEDVKATIRELFPSRGYTDRIRITRDAWMMDGARWAAQMSTCSRLQVGAVLYTEDGDVLSHGYNGPASGEPHCHHPDDSPCTAAVHAESNALARAGRRGVITLGASLYVTHAPCYGCAGMLINAGVKLVRYDQTYRSDAGLERLAARGIPVIGPA